MATRHTATKVALIPAEVKVQDPISVQAVEVQIPFLVPAVNFLMDLLMKRLMRVPMMMKK